MTVMAVKILVKIPMMTMILFLMMMIIAALQPVYSGGLPPLRLIMIQTAVETVMKIMMMTMMALQMLQMTVLKAISVGFQDRRQTTIPMVVKMIQLKT